MSMSPTRNSHRSVPGVLRTVRPNPGDRSALDRGVAPTLGHHLRAGELVVDRAEVSELGHCRSGAGQPRRAPRVADRQPPAGLIELVSVGGEVSGNSAWNAVASTPVAVPTLASI
jgi:hypothetical protein